MLSAESYSEYICDVKNLGTNFSKFTLIFGDRIWEVLSLNSFLCSARICPKIPVKVNSSRLKVFGLDHIGLITCERWMCVDSPLCRESSQGIHGLIVVGLVCEGETVGKIGEVDEIERELVLA